MVHRLTYGKVGVGLLVGEMIDGRDDQSARFWLSFFFFSGFGLVSVLQLERYCYHHAFFWGGGGGMVRLLYIIHYFISGQTDDLGS